MAQAGYCSAQFSLIQVYPNLEKARQIIDFLTKYHTTDMKYYPKPEKLFSKFNFYEAADWDGKIVGYTSYSKLSDWLAMTHATCVHPDHRGKGYGKTINELMEKILKEHKGFGKLTCEIYAENTRMLKIKLDSGWIVEGYRKHHYDPHKHEYTLGKILDEDLID